MSRKMRGQMTTLEVGSYNKMVQMPTPRPKWVKKTNLHGEWLYPNSKKGFERTVCSWIMDGGWRGSQAVSRPRPDTTDTSQYLLCILTLCPGDQLSSAQFVWSQPGVVLVTLKLNIPYGQSSAKLPVTQSFSHSVTWSLGQLVTS